MSRPVSLFSSGLPWCSLMASLILLLDTWSSLSNILASFRLHLWPVSSRRRITSGRYDECFIVPPASVGEDRLGRFVFVVESSEEGFGIVHKTPVEIGELTPDGLEILEGLKDGNYLVTAGVSRIQDSLKVRFNKPGEEK